MVREEKGRMGGWRGRRGESDRGELKREGREEGRVHTSRLPRLGQPGGKTSLLVAPFRSLVTSPLSL